MEVVYFKGWDPSPFQVVRRGIPFECLEADSQASISVSQISCKLCVLRDSTNCPRKFRPCPSPGAKIPHDSTSKKTPELLDQIQISCKFLFEEKRLRS